MTTFHSEIAQMACARLPVYISKHDFQAIDSEPGNQRVWKWFSRFTARVGKYWGKPHYPLSGFEDHLFLSLN